VSECENSVVFRFDSAESAETVRRKTLLDETSENGISFEEKIGNIAGSREGPRVSHGDRDV
jgi:hypothetical protein